MSKAFTKEDDQSPEAAPARPASVLPPGAKNYLTEAGAERFRRELEGLQEALRLRLAREAESPGGRARVQPMEERIRELKRILRTASVVKPSTRPPDTVRFGASVRIRSRSGEEACYRIVGVDEADPERGAVSWLSPVAQALLHAGAGDRIMLQTPQGEEELEVLSISWPGTA